MYFNNCGGIRNLHNCNATLNHMQPTYQNIHCKIVKWISQWNLLIQIYIIFRCLIFVRVSRDLIRKLKEKKFQINLFFSLIYFIYLFILLKKNYSLSLSLL